MPPSGADSGEHRDLHGPHTAVPPTSPPSVLPDSGENIPAREISNKKKESDKCSHSIPHKDYKKFTHGKHIPEHAELQYIKQQLIGQCLVHNRFVMTLPKDVQGDTEDLQLVAVEAYSRYKFWYVDFEIVGPASYRNAEAGRRSTEARHPLQITSATLLISLIVFTITPLPYLILAFTKLEHNVLYRRWPRSELQG